MTRHEKLIEIVSEKQATGLIQVPSQEASPRGLVVQQRIPGQLIHVAAFETNLIRTDVR